MRVLVACEFSGVVRDAFLRRGHDAYSCDIVRGTSPTRGRHIVANVLTILDDGWDLMIAHPPCTYLAVTGNRHYQGTSKRKEALGLVRALLECSIPLIALENPVGVISTQIRKPTQIIYPFQYGHTARKRTCLWLKGLPTLYPTHRIKPIFNELGFSHDYDIRSPRARGRDRGRSRSVTYLGVAEAMAEQWG